MIWLQKKLLVQILAECFTWYPKETGGLLTGYFVKSGDAVITHVTGAGKKASHTLYGYNPDDEYDRKRIEVIYRQTKKQSVYLGEWHTHPKANAYLSQIDKETFFKIATYDEARMPTPIMMVLSTAPFQLKAWQVRDNKINDTEVTLYS